MADFFAADGLLPLLPPWQAALVAAPSLCLGAAALAAGRLRDPAQRWRLAEAACLAALAAWVAGTGALLALGGGTAAGWLRSDALGATVLGLVAFIGWIVVRYSRPYLDGARGQRRYVQALLTVLAAVTAVAVANHLLLLAAAWCVATLALQRLLGFFGERLPARLAAHKEFVVSRAADACLAAALVLLASTFGTLRLDALAQAAASGLPPAAHAAIVLVAVAALLRCAQLPLHGWLIQVMEAPTPVSALLHAGVVNLGGFVLMRLSALVAQAEVAQALLVAAGTFTAVVAALVMGTRVSVKVALAWSTCAQMGFMLLQCGLGLWGMALLHLVAHSLYKAHAFLAAGGTVQRTSVLRIAPAPQPTSGAGQALGALAGVALAALAARTWGFDAARAAPALWLMAAVLALSLVPLLQPRQGQATLAWRLAAPAAAFGLAAAWFGAHALSHALLGEAATTSGTGPLWAVAAAGFALLFGLQALLAARPGGTLARWLYPWFYGGLFLDERCWRLLWRLLPPPREPAPQVARPMPATAGVAP